MFLAENLKLGTQRSTRCVAGTPVYTTNLTAYFTENAYRSKSFNSLVFGTLKYRYI